MARRPELREDNILTREELKEMRRGLSQLSLEAARHAYQTAYARCRMVNDRIPSAVYAGTGAGLEAVVEVEVKQPSDIIRQ